MATAYQYDPTLARLLILDELFDLSLYMALREISTDADAANTLDALVLIETRHLAFWQKFFDLKLDRLNLGRQLKLWSSHGSAACLGPQQSISSWKRSRSMGSESTSPSGTPTKTNPWAKRSKVFCRTSSNMRMCS
jgi:hypothetical protein